MNISEPARQRIILLLALALAGLVGRVVATTFGAPATVARVFYLFALGSLTACVLVIVTD